MVTVKEIGKTWYTVKKHSKTWFTVNIVYCKKAKLVHTQDPDAAYHDGPDKCAHLNPNIAQSMVKSGIQ